MSTDRIIRPAPHAAACINCSAWWAWDSIPVTRETPGGYVIIGHRPTGQSRAAAPSINPDAIGSETAVWPVVGAGDWCRSFQRAQADDTGEAA